jgi:hypothetical protein
MSTKEKIYYAQVCMALMEGLSNVRLTVACFLYRQIKLEATEDAYIDAQPPNMNVKFLRGK